MHFHVFRKRVVQEKQLTLIQRPVSLVEDTGAGGDGRQPSPTAQEGADLSEVFQYQNRQEAVTGNKNGRQCQYLQLN